LVINTKMDGKSGDRVSMDLIPRFNYTPRVEGDALEGHEGSLSHHTFNLTLEERHILIRYRGKLDEMRPAWELPGVHEQRLRERGGEVIDEDLFDALQATDPNKVFYGGSVATTTATLTASDLITPKKMVECKTWMETGGNRTQNAIRKIRSGGISAYMALLHNDVFFDLWNDPTIQQAYRDAQTRGDSNPLFREADMVWNNIVVYKHENIDIFTNGGSGSDVKYAKGFMIGAGGMAWAWGQRPEVATKTFEYDNEVGHNFNYIAAAGRPEFNSQDYGVTGLYCARTQISDA
jgi:N4-gp56 family major capsid protein